MDLNAKRMEEGEIDLLTDLVAALPGNMKMRILLEEPFLMAQRKGHPRGRGQPELAEYCALQHVIVAPEHGGVGGFMDAYLEKLGHQRDVALSVPQFMMVPEILKSSDFVCTLPRTLLGKAEDHFDWFELPFKADNFCWRWLGTPGIRMIRG